MRNRGGGRVEERGHVRGDYLIAEHGRLDRRVVVLAGVVLGGVG